MDQLVSNVDVAHCDTCNEVTPQQHQTCGSCCNVCLNNNSYKIDRIFTKAKYDWLAFFWQRKYFQTKYSSSLNISINAQPSNLENQKP